MGYLDLKSLVVVNGKPEADSFTTCARTLGYRNFDLEFTVTNIVAKLQDPSYDICIVSETVAGPKGMDRLFVRLHGNAHSRQIPLVVITGRVSNELEEAYYADGASQYVVHGSLSSKKLAELLLITSSLISFSNQFKEGRERLFRRS